ncbi:structural maintenance of chromosomes protein 5-like [Mya arenaria]|uniref:structural maintenance of chromosomes protein 5-like n=1 Tax=Mya arenaria TaxID=6604 RepID=UPI0022E33C1A|nr:structural maintenance of chromosomes protein 5-like [Mya arenaria]
MSYTEGSIVNIKLENVLTYDDVEFTCGPHLNVIIGPNGTGKSTIVCAICLGLAGKLSLLGRAQHPTDFIKHGKSRGRIELELHNNDGDNYRIKREISKEGPQNKWWVNGRQATQKSIEDLVARLNIQVGNLTQFLPQEKVSDFAKMSEFELLENTEKAIGDPEMYELHMKLKDSRNNARELELQFNSLQERLNQEKAKNARIEQDVKSFEERQKFLEQIQNLKMKKAWVEYEERRQIYLTDKENKQKAEKEVKRLRDANAPLQKKIADAVKRKDEVHVKIKAKTRELRNVAESAEKNGSEVDNLTDKYVDVKDELKFKREQEESRKKRLRDLNKQLEALETDLRNLDDTENVQPKIEKVNKSMREVTVPLGQINHQGDTLRMEVEKRRKNMAGINKELQSLRNIENQRLEGLRSKHRDTYTAVMWLRENKARFKGIIHEPIMLCVNMRNPEMAKYLENHISFNDMRAFVCENSEDMNMFMDVMREEQNLRVNAVVAPTHLPQDQQQPSQSIENLRRYGFECYLQDLFTCPDAVMRFLCRQYRVHNIPVGNARTKDLVANIIKEVQLACFYTSDNQYKITKSRYDQSTSSRNMKLKNASLLTSSMDAERESYLLQQLQEETDQCRSGEEQYGVLQDRSRHLEQQLSKLRDEKKQLMSRKDQKKRLQSQIETKKQTISSVENETVDIDNEEKLAKKKIADINALKMKNLKQYIENTERCVEVCKAKVCLGLRHAEAVREVRTMEAAVREQTQALQQAENKFTRVKEQLHNSKIVAKRLLEEAKRTSGIRPDQELPEETRETFLSLPDTLEEIEARISEHQVRADLTLDIDRRIIAEFHRRKGDIDRLEKEVTDKEQEKDSHQEKIEEAKARWLGPLQELIGRINKAFSHFFRKLQSVGEVELHIPDNPEEYSKYGIKIKVKFRDSEPLRELSAHHQSGGERSVTTVLYMMALQELAKVPFRCVDEINQGMDPVNERKVFELVVQTVCKESSSQYFLLTPKLLPDLEYAPAMTVLCVYNGPHMLKHTEWNLKRFIKRGRPLRDS